MADLHSNMSVSKTLHFSSTTIDIPDCLLENADILQEIISSETWNEVLNRDEKLKLLKCLPKFEQNDTEEKKETLRVLFAAENFFFGSPCQNVWQKMKDGYFDEGAQFLRETQQILKTHENSRAMLQLKLQNLRKIIDEKQKMGLGMTPSERQCLENGEMAVKMKCCFEDAAESSLTRILARVEQGATGSAPVSDDEDEEYAAQWNSSKSGERLAVLNRRLVSLQRTGGSRHHPELDTTGISWRLLLSRERRRRLSQTDSPSVPSSTTKIKQTANGSSAPTPSCFFALLKMFLSRAPKCSLDCGAVEERVRDWLTKVHPAPAWSSAHNWVQLTEVALRYLSGRSPPLTEYKPRGNVWCWVNRQARYDTNSALKKLCAGWLSAGMPGAGAGAATEENVPRARCPSTWRVRMYTAEELEDFHRQEGARFRRPQRPFVYRQHGYSSCVGPVRTAAGAAGKAREHPLLRSDRPACVTILELVRDAAARLPNGEGSRQELVQLARCSQYWRRGAEERQVQQVVSSALDRLQVESADPSVKYHPERRMWVYRHRHKELRDYLSLSKSPK